MLIYIVATNQDTVTTNKPEPEPKPSEPELTTTEPEPVTEPKSYIASHFMEISIGFLGLILLISLAGYLLYQYRAKVYRCIKEFLELQNGGFSKVINLSLYVGERVTVL